MPVTVVPHSRDLYDSVSSSDFEKAVFSFWFGRVHFLDFSDSKSQDKMITKDNVAVVEFWLLLKGAVLVLKT